MTGSYSAILGGILGAFLLGYGVGWVFKSARQVVEVATKIDS